jgi:hypothetical protein
MSIFEKGLKTFGKTLDWLHNLKLTSPDFLIKNYFVSIIFYYLIKKVFRGFLYC